MGYQARILRLGITMVLFVVIALTCIGLILTPVKVHTKTLDNEQVYAPNAMTIQGLQLRAEAWKEYPRYNIGLGIIGVIAFGGAINICAMMYGLRDRKANMGEYWDA